MKLIKIEEARDRKKADNSAQELRGVQLDKVLKDKRKEIDDLERASNRALAESMTRNLLEDAEWRKKKETLMQEVEDLESRKKAALVPLEEREQKVQDTESVLLKREEAVSLRESEVEDTEELLEDKLDAISEREQAATEYSDRLTNREFAIQIKEKQTKERSEALTKAMQESLTEITAAQADISTQKAILRGRDIAISEREKVVASKETSFADREKAINDKYLTLQRAIMETNLKKK